jgi:hypothetical protein
MKQPKVADLTAPLKSWSDSQGRKMHRLGDLPVGIEFCLEPGGPAKEVISYPRSVHTGKRQCKDMVTGNIYHEFCSKKVYVISKESEK